MNNVNSQIQSLTNGIKVPTGYTSQALSNGNISDTIANTGMNINDFVPNDKDNYNVDSTNLTKEQQEEITEYAADLINQVRQQMGEPTVSANTHMIDFANQIAADAYKDGVSSGHDTSALSNTFNNDSSLMWFGENLGP